MAVAAELCEECFDMSFGRKILVEGDDTTQLSAGDTVVLTKTKSQKDDAIAALRDLGETSLTEDRLKGLTDPMLVHLFLKAEVVTEIPRKFLQERSFEGLDLSGVPAVTQFSFFWQSLILTGWCGYCMKGLQRTQANQHNRCDTFLAFTSFRSDRNDVNGTNATDATQPFGT